MKKHYYIIPTIVSIIAVSLLFSFEIEIENTLTKQRDDGSMLYDVWFTVSSLHPGDSIDVNLEAFTTLGETLNCESFITPCNIGIVRNNGLKHILWDIGSDCNNREFKDDRVFVKIQAKEHGVNIKSCNFDFFVTDHTPEHIYHFSDFDGSDWEIFGTEGFGIGEFDHLNHIFVDTDNRIYVGDEYNDRVVKIENMDGDGWTVASFSHFRPTKCYPRDDYYYVVSRGSSLYRYTSLTSSTPEVYECPLGGEFYDFEFDSSGRIYLMDRGGAIIRINNFDGDGLIRYDASEYGGMSSPFDLCLDNLGRIYVADRWHHRIFRIDNMEGDNFISYGTSGTGINEFDEPAGICVDSDFHIYVTDWRLSRIIRVDNMDGDGWTTLNSTTSHTMDAPWDIFIRYLR